MTVRVDCIVIGAGVVGLAVARALQLSGREVYVLESSARIGQGISARSSEVIHSGLYYPNNTLKSMLCVEGRELLYQYCERRQVPINRLGKILVATNDSERAAIEQLKLSAEGNGVNDLQLLSQQELKRLEPEIKGLAGLLSPQTGVVDSAVLIGSLAADLENAGGRVVANSPVIGGEYTDGGLCLRVGQEPARLIATTVINAAGLHSTTVARSIEGIATKAVPTQKYAVGHYYYLQGALPFKRLVYPLPTDGGLGIHFTIDSHGKAKFGPDIRWTSTIDYAFDDSHRDFFIESIARYYPKIRERQLLPGYTGIRPKIESAEGLIKDFLIQEESDHKIPGLINLFGIESPGLTAALAIGEHLRRVLN